MDKLSYIYACLHFLFFPHQTWESPKLNQNVILPAHIIIYWNNNVVLSIVPIVYSFVTVPLFNLFQRVIEFRITSILFRLFCSSLLLRIGVVFGMLLQVWQPWVALKCWTSCSRTSQTSTRSCARTCETRQPVNSSTSRKVNRKYF